MVWDWWSTGTSTSAGLAVVLVHACSRDIGTSTTVGSVGYGTGTGTGMDMGLALVLVLVWAQQGHWCQFWLSVEEKCRHSNDISTGTTCPAQVPERRWYW